MRAFSRRVQQEGALDLTQGDYKNADFAPHPEVVSDSPHFVETQRSLSGRSSRRSSLAHWTNSFAFFEGAWETLQPRIADGTFVIRNSSAAVALRAIPTLTRAQQAAIVDAHARGRA